MYGLACRYLVQKHSGCSGRLLGLLSRYFSRHLSMADRANILNPAASSQDHESSDLIGVVETDHRGEQQITFNLPNT